MSSSVRSESDVQGPFDIRERPAGMRGRIGAPGPDESLALQFIADERNDEQRGPRGAKARPLGPNRLTMSVDNVVRERASASLPGLAIEQLWHCAGTPGIGTLVGRVFQL